MYTFNLQSLLDHRKYREELLQKEVAQCLKALSVERVRYKALQRQRSKTIESMRSKQQADQHFMVLIPLFHGYLERNQLEIDQQSKRVQKVEADHTAKIEELVEARKKRETLEKLKERQYSAYLEEEKSKAQSEMNEVAVIGHLRRNREEFE